MQYTLGIDISTWNDRNDTPQMPDFAKAKANGAHFAFIRASQDTFPDPDFKTNWQNAKSAGLPRGAYHFFDLRPGKHTTKEQAQYFCSLLKGDAGELPPVMDYERPNASYPELPPHDQSLSIIEEFSNVVYAELGEYPIIYTNWSALQYRLDPVPEWLRKRGLWLAGYPYVNAGETPQQAADKALARGSYDSNRWFGWPWTFWQFSDRGDGAAFGMESKQVDLDYFNGSPDKLAQYCGCTPKPEPTDAEKLRILWADYKKRGGV